MVELTGAQLKFRTATNGVQAYHDYFGTPTYNDQIWFELLTVGVYQVGLSWQVAAGKLPVFRRLMQDLAIENVAALTEIDVEALLQQPEMLKNRRKLEATIQNARAILQLQADYGSFSAFLWASIAGEPLLVSESVIAQGPLKESQQMVKSLKKYGFKFVGPVVTRLFLQAGGIIQEFPD